MLSWFNPSVVYWCLPLQSWSRLLMLYWSVYSVLSKVKGWRQIRIKKLNVYFWWGEGRLMWNLRNPKIVGLTNTAVFTNWYLQGISVIIEYLHIISFPYMLSISTVVFCLNSEADNTHTSVFVEKFDKVTWCYSPLFYFY